MRKPSLWHSSNEHGHIHFILPVLVIAVITLMGGYIYLRSSSALTATPINAVFIQSGVSSSKCLDDNHDGKGIGTRVQLYSCNKSAAQMWTIMPNGTIVNKNGMCIWNWKGLNVDHNHITMNTCSTTDPAEQWKRVGTTLVNPVTNKCLDDPAFTTNNSAQIILFHCNGGKNQNWTPVPVSSDKKVNTGGTVTTGGGSGGGIKVGTNAPPAGTNAVVDFRSKLNVAALNDYSIGDTISTYGGNSANISNTSWRDTLKALGPLAWRIPLRYNNGNPVGGGSGGGGSGVGYINDIKAMNGVPVVIVAGRTGDDDVNSTDAGNFVHFFNDGGGKNGGPVKSWIIGNEPDNGYNTATYVSNLTPITKAMKSADSSITISAGAVAWFDNGLLSSIKNSSASSDITTLSYHGYEGGDGKGQYSTPDYLAQAQTVAKMGKQPGLEEFNWNSKCAGNGVYNSTQNLVYMTSIIGNSLAGGAHAYMYSDSNGCGTLSDGQHNGGLSLGTRLPEYWALGMWTGMNGQFDRFGSNLVDSSVGGVKVNDAAGKNNGGLGHEVELYATNNGKILAINKNTSTTENITIGLGGLTTGTYNVWQTNSGNALAAPTEVTKGASYSGSKITISLPAGTVSSIDLH